jgi:CRP-like cAMP-binding protein
LTRITDGRTVLECKAKQTVFSQGDRSDAVFYIQRGRVQLTVVSQRGREAILGVLGANEFFGEQCIAGERSRVMTVTALEDCSLVRVEKRKMLETLPEDPDLSMAFITYLLSRNLRLQEDLVDHFFNHSEKRLARLLLSLARHEEECKTEEILPKISQQTLAEMVGTTRGRVSHFMSKFRKQGLVDYNAQWNSGLRVHSSLLKMMLRDYS